MDIQPVERNKFILSGTTGRNEWWRYALIVLMSLVGYVIGSIPLLIFQMRAITSGKVAIYDPELTAKLLNPEIMGLSPYAMLALTLFIFVVAMIGLLVGVKFIAGKTISSIITGYGTVRWQRVVAGAGWWALLSTISTGIVIGADPQNYEWTFNAAPFMATLAIGIILLPIQTWWEEFLFRGYLMQGIANRFQKPWAGLLGTSLLFAAMHMMNPEVEKYGILATFPQYLVPALMLGFITLMDEGLELAMGMHFANNLFGTVVVTSSNSAIQASTLWRANQTDSGIDSIILISQSILFIIILWWKFKWHIQKLNY